MFIEVSCCHLNPISSVILLRVLLPNFSEIMRIFPSVCMYPRLHTSLIMMFIVFWLMNLLLMSMQIHYRGYARRMHDKDKQGFGAVAGEE